MAAGLAQCSRDSRHVPCHPAADAFAAPSSQVHSIYENSFNKLTDRYYKNAPWPPAEAIAPLVDNDEQFLLLYKELYYRRIHLPSA